MCLSAILDISNEKKGQPNSIEKHKLNRFNDVEAIRYVSYITPSIHMPFAHVAHHTILHVALTVFVVYLELHFPGVTC